MRRTRRSSSSHTNIEPNLTSLIDVTFLLLVFFVLVSRLSEVEAVDVDLPHPREAATMLPEAEDQVAVSVRPQADGRAAGYQVGADEFSPDETGLVRLAAHLVDLYRSNPHINLNVRADRSTHFEAIQPLLDAVTKAVRAARNENGAVINPRINIMVIKEAGSS